MALKLDDPEVDALVTEVARLAGESTTEAVRQSLLERKARLISAPLKRSERAADILREIRSRIPPELMGKRMTREEEDEILGFGPKDGY